MGKGFKHVMYDSFNKQILVKRIGSDIFEKVPFVFDYWTPDESGQSEIKDCYGTPMRRVECKDKNTLKVLRDNGVKLAESDINEVTKFLHKEYDSEELDTDIKNFNICFFDIEVQTGREFYLSHKIRIRNAAGQEVETTIRDFEDKLDTKRYEVWDEKEQAWGRYDGSCYHNSEFPEPERAACPINLITCYSTKTDETYTWGLEPYTGNSELVTNYRYFESELEMMKDWCKWVNKQNFDIMSGWNSALFDVPYIMNRLEKLAEMNKIKTDLTTYLSPLGRAAKSKTKTQVKTGKNEGETFEIPGLLSIDYMEVFKKFAGYQNLPSWKLNYVGELELGEGKLEYQGAISEIYRNDWNKYTEYNVQDVLLLKKIENKKKLWDLVVSFAFDCLIPLDKVFSMIATVEGYMLKYLHSQKMVMNDKKPKGRDWWHDEQMYVVREKDGTITYQNCEYEKGIYTFEPFAVKAGFVYADPGRYDHVMSGDITSSYPHQMMMYNISPEVKVIKPTQEQIDSGEVIRSEINGVGFRRTDNAILPSIVKKVFAERKHYKKLMKEAHKAGDFIKEAQYDNLQHGAKIIINSVYGVSLNENFHFFDIDCARSITRCARHCIRYLMENTNKYYKSKQILKDSMKYFPIINFKYDGQDHWKKTADKIKVTEIATGIESEIEAIQFKKELFLLEGHKIEEIVINNLTQHAPLETRNRKECVVQVDTDSNYGCFDEHKTDLFPYMDDMEWFYCLEKLMEDFWAKILQVKADKNQMPQLIVFNRENMFSHFFSYAKKLYLGHVVDSEGEYYGYEHYHKKIKGIVLTKAEFPVFCQENCTSLCFDIAAGLKKEDAEKRIIDNYKEFCKQPVDVIASKRGISDYKKYITKPMTWYLKNGLQFEKGQPSNAKMALTWNYICAKNNLSLEPIQSGSKFNFIQVKENNKYGVDNIAFIGAYPNEFKTMFEIDYEMAFRKLFLSPVESMMKILGWLGEKEQASLKPNKFKKFIS